MKFRQGRAIIGLILIVGFCFLSAGCAAFLEDYSYNPAGSLYTN